MKACKLKLALFLICAAGVASAQSASSPSAPRVVWDNSTPSEQGRGPGISQGGGAPQQAGPGGGQRPPGPPPEALAACNGKAAGAVCNFTDREGLALSGTCMGPPPAQAQAQGAAPQLGCRPNRGGQNGPGGQGGAGAPGGPGGQGCNGGPAGQSGTGGTAASGQGR